MKGKIALIAPLLALLLPVLSLSTPLAASAQQDMFWGDDGAGSASDIEDELGVTANDPRTIIVKLIKFLFGFLGILAVVIILRGGFMWMTAGGNDTEVGNAKKMIIQGAVGLLIIFSAYAVANFAINALFETVNTQ